MYNPIRYTNAFGSIIAKVNKGNEALAITSLTDSAMAMMVAAFPKYRWKLLVVADEQKGKRLWRDIKSYQENAWYYPAKDFLFYQADTRGTLITRQRVEVLSHVLEEKGGVVIACIDALMDKVGAKEEFRQSVLHIEPGQIIEMEALVQKLSEMGYRRLSEVEAMGEFSVRGGIVDIFPFTVDNPVRIEFWDLEVDNIRSFDIDSQRSLEGLDKVEIYPASDHGTMKKGGQARQVSLIDYFSDDTITLLDEPDRLRERGGAVEAEFVESFEARKEAAGKKGSYSERTEAQQVGDVGELIYTVDDILSRLLRGTCIAFSLVNSNLSVFNEAFPSSICIPVETADVPAYRNNFDMLRKDLAKWQKEKRQIVLFSASGTRASRLAQTLRDEGMKAYCPDMYDAESGAADDSDAVSAVYQKIREENPGSIKIMQGYIHTGFRYSEENLVVLTETDMFGNAGEIQRKRRRRKLDGIKIRALSEISPGDYVVEEDHGVGIYRGIDRVTVEDITKDYIKIEYADGGFLYLPATMLSGIQKYAASEGKQPRLNRLGGVEWQRTRKRVQKAVKDMAKELCQLYAARQKLRGFRFGADTVWQREFEEMFPYEETPDQELAIEAAKADMESGRIMDRLICGDVGYGKTEIALRAAFKAVQDSMQVAYLVPTTILAQQVYNTFTERMKGFPVNVGLLCRFRTAEQNKKSIQDLQSGRLDIIIGTHRLLSKDVSFHKLGLLIVDEEQRFGVSHKEKIKELKKDVDVLTLTATPIPRTLHMSLSGIRDMSILEEPPIDRLPVQTYVMEYNEELVREAIHRELARNGQVYYVHNRVRNIQEIAQEVQDKSPEARVAYAHGQMSERELEDVMLRFIGGEIDVLVSTTIIETGLDIPNANTLIIRDADYMGLSQLYQLRGRVGRSSRTAYAFFMYRKGKMLTEESEKRLKAIKEFTELGSGIRIAMRDLEIRGAGNVLGAEQHGHMGSVGYELYCKLLQQAVQEEKGEAEERKEFETQVECDINAYIPDNYISDESQKLDAYKRISSIASDEDYMDIQDELCDRYGNLPNEVLNLLNIAKLKALAHACYVSELNISRGQYRMLMHPDADILVEKIPEVVELSAGQLRFMGGPSPVFLFQAARQRSSWSLERTMEHVSEVLRRIKKKRD